MSEGGGEDGLNVQYRGTPERKIPSRSKRSRHRQSQEAHEVGWPASSVMLLLLRP